MRNRLKWYRKEVLKISQEVAADRTGISLGGWIKVENGADCYISTAFMISNMLGVPVEELWYTSANEPAEGTADE